MPQYLVIVSFKLNQPDLLADWKTLSKEIDQDISKATGFIARDSGIDAQGLVYCLVKWESKAHHKTFSEQLQARDNWDEMMAYFGKIANMNTMTQQSLEVF